MTSLHPPTAMTKATVAVASYPTIDANSISLGILEPLFMPDKKSFLYRVLVASLVFVGKLLLFDPFLCTSFKHRAMGNANSLLDYSIGAFSRLHCFPFVPCAVQLLLPGGILCNPWSSRQSIPEILFVAVAMTNKSEMVGPFQRCEV